MDIQKKIIKLINNNIGEPFWEMDKFGYKETLIEFFEEFNIELDEYDITIIEEKRFEDKNGIERSIAILEIHDYAIRFKMSAFFDSKWYFSFENQQIRKKETTVEILPINSDMIITLNGEKCVLFLFECPSEGNQIFAIPLRVAESINIQQYEMKEISREADFLYKIEQYKLPFFSSYNCQ